MMHKIFGVVFGLLLSSAALAQDYGATIGIHQTTATADTAGMGAGIDGTVNGKLGFDAGLTASFELMPMVRFRTGLLYDQRQFDFKITKPAGAVGTVQYNFAYLDVPVNVQYNFTPMIGLYGGMIVGVKASDSTKVPAGAATFDPNMKSLYPLINVGANFMFNDMLGFDLFYERGMGDFADHVSNYSTFGMHFIYWL